MKWQKKPHLNEVLRLKNPEGQRIQFSRLDKNERTIGFGQETWQEMLKDLNPETLTVYPENGEFIDKLAHWVGVQPEQVYLTAGSDLAIKSCFESFVSPGDQVLCLAPTFAMFSVYANLFQAHEISIPARPDLTASVDDLVAAITDKCSLVYVANPNSPTGKELSMTELEKLVVHCDKMNCPLLIDEAYYGFSKTTALKLIDRFSNLIVCRTFSKACGLAGLRLGFAVGQEAIIEEIAKWRPMYEVNSLAIHFANYLIGHDHLIADYVEQVNQAKEMIYQWGEQQEVKVFTSDANFVNIQTGKAIGEKVISDCFEKRILLKWAGKGTPLEECIRISAGTPEQVQTVLDIIDDAIKRH